MPKETGTSPNVVLINCDDLGWGDLGCYGAREHNTPHLDRMAREGLVFTDFYAPSPVCSPSRGALLTGCYPPRIDFADFDGKWVLFPGDAVGLGPDELTLARLFKSRGYRTKIVGKWHCGDQPEFLPRRFGFDEYFGLPYSNDMGRQRGSRASYPPLPLMDDDAVLEQQPDQASLTERYLSEALRFIRRNAVQPFFLYFAHMYVHLPLYVPQRFLNTNKNPYAAAVECIDWSAGVLMHGLRELGLEENTIVIFTSDNGSRCDFGRSNGPLRGTKFTTWEGGQRVPGIIRWPSRIRPGRVSSSVVSAVDLLPTFAELIGCTEAISNPIDGISLNPILIEQESRQPPTRPFVYYFGNALEAIRVGRWKLHFCKWSDSEGRYLPMNALYDLQSDAGEQKNLYDDHPEVVGRLDGVARQYRLSLGDSFTGTAGVERRLKGRVANAVPLTQYQEGHPYYIAEYDLSDFG